MSKSKRYHVLRDADGQWLVKRAGANNAIKQFARQSDAINAARNVARHSGGELVVHGRDGRIKAADTYPKGYGSLKGEYVVRKGIDLTKPLYKQTVKGKD
jgi:hypothetical protein